ncbi:hypothetical protein [Nosocomiicoccus ampullae]|uniref:hypothetical protein n=1 Tax=Nosocomiicoccus ampullae TaxID=489910 RepID=UPI001C5F851A|nr:hypothetical protein [Nosocomiicoccus ampullae]QYA47977.1 hypothetical protein KPF52_05840 [Nosocomiicoccus ampullae]
MLKTITKTKQMRLDELIKYCIENDIEDTKYSVVENTLMSKGFTVLSDPSYKSFRVSGSGNFKITGYINKDDLFLVEIEEEITEDTKIDRLVEVYTRCSQLHVIYHTRNSINEILSEEEKYGVKTLTIYALIDDKLELIWEEKDND